MSLIKLTTYNSGLDSYVDPAEITAILGLMAYQSDGVEGGQRTRVEYGRGRSVLVTETPAEVIAAMEAMREEKSTC